MVQFPNCKINIGLRVVRKRTDGFHDIESLFYPLPFVDALEIIGPGASAKPLSTRLHQTGFIATDNTSENFCLKAYHLLAGHHPGLPAVDIHLHKAIPMGAGLGGGSSDGAFALKMLNKILGLGLSDQQLRAYALNLGSDCPFFIRNQPCIARGRGDEMEALKFDLKAYKIIIINPGIHINTRWAFQQVTPSVPDQPMREIIEKPMEQWRQTLVNDFEIPVFAAYPEIKVIKEELYKTGARYASMSGSGSTVYGIFDKTEKPVIRFPSHYFIKELSGELQ